MRRFFKLNIYYRLILALVTALAVLVGFGIFTIVRMDTLASVTKKIYADPLRISKTATETRVDIIRIQREVKDLLLLSDETKSTEMQLEIALLTDKVHQRLDVISQKENCQQISSIGEELKELFFKWKYNKDRIMEGNSEGRVEEAANLTRSNNIIVEEMEEKLILIANIAEDNANSLVNEAYEIEQSLKFTATVLMFTLSTFLILLFALIIRSILVPINTLKSSMNKGIETDELEVVKLEGSNEIVDISNYYNMLIRKLQDQFWIKDSENYLNQAVSGDVSLIELTNKALSYIVRTVEAGKGALYVYDDDQKNLTLTSYFAFTEREKLSNEYQLGEGVVGQVALERKPILLKNINKQEEYISTALSKEAPTNTYTFPLILENKLYGVIELASFHEFTEIKKEFLNIAADIVAICLKAALQNEKIKNLLRVSEEAQKEASVAAENLQQANIILEEQQQQLQQQTAELQQTNAELEEQQQLLQHQSEELQKTNSQLEEQQQILEQQTSLLNMKNTELEKTKDELIRYSQNLELGNRYKTEFLANMSHELRTPLNSIILLSRLLLNNKNGMTQDDLDKVGVINNSGQELLRLIDDILDLSKIEAGRVDMNKTEFSTAELSKEARQLFEKLAEEKGVRFSVEDRLNATLIGDRDKVSQILRNLISNAIKFTEEGSVTLRIDSDPNTITSAIFTVTDTGIGIPKENLERIFEAFQQGDGSISRRFGGTGLGLSISRKLAELMGGKILVESKPNRGSSFTLTMENIVGKSLNQRGMNKPHIMESAAAKEEIKLWETSKIVLLIEDDIHFAEYIREINKALGIHTLVATNGKDGLKSLKNQKVDGVLLDLMLPDISGLDILNEMKSSPDLKHIPVHIISSWKKNSTPQKMGAIGYKEKPMDAHEIKKVVIELLNYKEKKNKVLVISDNNNRLDSIKRIIQDEKIQVISGDTIDDGKLKLEEEKYDVIILDLQKKESSEIYSQINVLNLDTPIIVYNSSGRSETEDHEKELRKLFDRMSIKVVASSERLVDEVTSLLSMPKKINKASYLVSKTNIEHALRLDGKKILIVDDDTRNIFVLATALEEYGAEIFEAENGKEALSVLKESKIDLVLMDIMMPVMNGFETIKAIRRDEILKDIPVIAITAKSLKEDRERCIMAGANDYISKPVDYDTLIRLVKAWIDKR